jgi:hypothetical protein
MVAASDAIWAGRMPRKKKPAGAKDGPAGVNPRQDAAQENRQGPCLALPA